MASGEERRCDDCLAEFRAGDSRFMVLKENTDCSYNEEERKMDAHIYEAAVCLDCVGWYHGDYFEATNDECFPW